MVQEEEDEQIEEERVCRIELIYHRLQEGENPDTVWLSLHEEERQEFWKVLNSGELAALTIKNESLMPWYCLAESNGLVEDVTIDYEGKIGINIVIPENIPLISSLIPGGHASNLLGFNFVEIVYVYCFNYRLFAGDWNGDHQNDVIESLLRLSRVLNPTNSSARNFQAYSCVKECVKSLLELSVLVCIS